MKQRWLTLFLVVAIIAAMVGVGPVGVARAQTGITYYSQGSLAPNLLASWNTIRGGGGSSPASFTSGDIFVIQNGHNMTTSATWSISGTGSRLWIESGGTLTANNAVTLAAVTTFQIDNGGTYVHNNGTAYGTSIFQGTESFSVNSTVVINNSNTTGPSNVTFGNLTINFTSDPGGSVNCAGGVTAINGNLTIQSTSTREFRLTGNTSLTLNLVGNLTISGGTLNLTNGSGAPTINMGGNFSQTGGTFTSSGSVATVVFTGGSSIVTFSTSGGTFTNGNINWQIASGKTVGLNTNFGAGGWVNAARTMTVNGAFQINQGAWPGNTGTWSYGAAGTLVYNNSTGSYGVGNDNYWPTTNGPVNVTVLGAGGITMNVARTVNGLFQTSAQVINGGNLTLNGTTQINTGGYFSASSPTYGGSSTLIYNPGGNYNTSYEWVTGGTVGSGVSQNVIVQNNTNLNVSGAHTVPGTLTVDSGSTIAFDNSLTVNGSATINGTAQINTGGYFANSPTYGSSALLIYNTGGVYDRRVEWNAASGAGYPHHVQLSNSTALNPGGNGNQNTAFALAGNLTIDNGSALYMDYGSNDMNVPLTVGGHLTLNGSLSLSDNIGGDAAVGGNWTNSGTFTPNHRAVFFNGSAPQQLAGATTFDYLTLNNASGLTLNSNVAVNQTLDLANGDISTGSNVLTLGGSVTGSGDVVGTARRTSLAANTAYAFSNARTQLTFVSPLSIPQMDVTLAKSTPPSFVYALPRRYTLSEPGVAFSAIVQLAYKPAEIPGGTVENNIRLWRYDTGASAWENRGGTVLTFVSPWGAVSQTGITQFSDWVLSGVTPTSVTLTGLDAQPQSNDLWLGAGLLLGVVLLLIGWQMQRRRA